MSTIIRPKMHRTKLGLSLLGCALLVFFNVINTLAVNEQKQDAELSKTQVRPLILGDLLAKNNLRSLASKVTIVTRRFLKAILERLIRAIILKPRGPIVGAAAGAGVPIVAAGGAGAAGAAPAPVAGGVGGVARRKIPKWGQF